MLFAPNAFTPNNDGKNDYFYIKGIGIDNINHIRIYDRWGKIAYEITDIQPNIKELGWDGTNMAGKKLNGSVFVYHLKATCSGGQVIEKQGNITLIR